MTKQPMTRQNLERNAPRQNIQSSTRHSSSKAESRAYSYNESIASNGIQRTFHVYVPPSYSHLRPMPLVMVFHGLGMKAESMTAITGFNGIAAREGFIVVYGQAKGGKWNDGMSAKADNDDIEYVNTMLARLKRRINIDSRRIYAVGLSNGGYFCQLLACTLTDSIAAIGVVGATAMQQGLDRLSSHKPVPAIFFIGSEDPLVNWGDDKSRSLGKYAKNGAASIEPRLYSIARLGGWLTVSDTIAFWVRHNGESLHPRTAYLPDRDPTDGMRVKKESYGSGSREVILYTIEGDSHSWPGAIYLPGITPRTCQDISAAEEIWQFFKSRSR